MLDRPGTAMTGETTVQLLLQSAAARLAGRWDDPMAWKIVCEELAAAWRGRPEVAWVLVLTRCGLEPLMTVCDQEHPAAVVWTAQGTHSAWFDLTAEPGFWSRLAAASSDRLTGSGPPPVQGPDLVARTGLVAGPWLAGGVDGPHGPAMAIVLGLTAPGSTPALVADLAATAAMLAPLLGLQRRLADITATAAATRSECETLSRLGDLRTRLAAVTAHELKTPLTSITAYAEVLERQIGDPGFKHADEFLRVIRSEADRLLRLVDRLLDSSRRGSGPALGSLEPVPAGPLVQEVRRIMAPQAARRELQLNVHVPEGVPRLQGDADLVRQVLLNLVGNALKFTPAGGQVTLSVREDASTVRLAVADTGPGIAAEEMRAIFQSFYRTRSAAQVEGVGLGLSIVKEIVSLHGGHLDVHSRSGQGSTFGVHLPKEMHHTTSETGLTVASCDPALQSHLAALTLQLVAELATARGVAVILPAEQPGALVLAAALGLGHEAAGTLLPSGSELTRLVREEALLVPSVALLPASLEGIVDLPGTAMIAPLRLGDVGDQAGARGLILAARRLGGGVFGADDLILLNTLAEILGGAWATALAAADERSDQDLMTEALTALTGLRRRGVPTADPLALRLLSRTGRRLGLSSFEVRLLQYAGALHDAGMVLLEPDVLLKPAALDLDERDLIGRHPQRGIDLLGPLVELPELQNIIRYHHEWYDGRGYPEGRRGEAIPLGSRILAVVDAFFAMIRSRPWREGLPVAAAVTEIQRHAGSQFDARVVEGFLSTLLEEGLLSETGTEPSLGGNRR